MNRQYCSILTSIHSINNHLQLIIENEPDFVDYLSVTLKSIVKNLNEIVIYQITDGTLHKTDIFEIYKQNIDGIFDILNVLKNSAVSDLSYSEFKDLLDKQILKLEKLIKGDL